MGEDSGQLKVVTLYEVLLKLHNLVLRLCSDQKLKDVKEFIKTLPFSSVEPADFGTQLLDDVAISAINKCVETSKASAKPSKRVKMQVKPHLIFRVCR